MYAGPDAIIEHHFRCPYCDESISFLLDPSAADQAYIEDCEVCCQPIEALFSLDEDGAISGFRARRLDE